MNAIVSRYGDGRLHPDFGQDSRTTDPLYGIPINVVHGNSTAKVHVVIDAYAGESELQNVPIPSGAVIEGDNQNGPLAGVDNRGDSHLIVWDEDNNIAYELYRASRPSENSDHAWHADQESVWDMNTNTFRTVGWTSADAAGLAILPGLVRPDEGLPASEGGQGVIDHAIRFTLQNAVILNQFLYPASHTANPGNNNPATQPPMGARFRLKASVDISSLNPEARVIAQAMKDYGMIVADNGSNFYFSGASYSVDASNHFALTWNDNDIQDSVHGLKSLHYSDFEVVNLTPVVTGLGATSGPASTTLTVTGQNFAGAAGNLQVLFGSTPATSVTVDSDSQLTVVVPAGSGTVDVRVQSGVSDPGDASNIKTPVFGYGLSATSAADRFTYGDNGGGTSGNPATHFSVSAPVSSSAGDTFTITVTALDAGNNLASDYTGTVALTSNDPLITTPEEHTFAASAQGVWTLTYALDTTGDETIAVADEAASAIAGTADVKVSASAATHFGVTPPASAVIGSRFGVTVTALDDFDNVATGYGGTINLLSSDPAALFLRTYTFRPGDQGVHTFRRVRLRTLGDQAMTAADVESLSLTGQSDLTVVPVAPTRLAIRAVSGSQINLSWTDHSTAETGFLVERSFDALNWTEVAQVDPGLRSYHDTGLDPRTRYYYRVRVISTATDPVVYSAYTNWRTAMTAG
jgi:hypothetical protein